MSVNLDKKVLSDDGNKVNGFHVLELSKEIIRKNRIVKLVLMKKDEITFPRPIFSHEEMEEIFDEALENGYTFTVLENYERFYSKPELLEDRNEYILLKVVELENLLDSNPEDLDFFLLTIPSRARKEILSISPKAKEKDLV